MASDADFMAYVCDQLAPVGGITTRRMFGEYAVYCDGKVVAFICDNQLFVKPTDAARAWAGAIPEGFPYPGAKPHWLVDEGLERREWLVQLIRLTADALPLPKPKKPRKRASP